MVKYDTFEQLKKDIAYTYSVYCENVAVKCMQGTACIYDKTSVIQFTREVKALDLQNVLADDVQIATGKGDYSESIIKKAIEHINLIARTSYSLDFVTNDNVITNG